MLRKFYERFDETAEHENWSDLPRSRKHSNNPMQQVHGNEMNLKFLTESTRRIIQFWDAQSTDMEHEWEKCSITCESVHTICIVTMP